MTKYQRTKHIPSKQKIFYYGPNGTKRMRFVVAVSIELQKHVEEFCRKNRTYPSAAIRAAIEQYTNYDPFKDEATKEDGTKK